MRKLTGARFLAAALMLALVGGVGAACSSEPGSQPARRSAGYFDVPALLDAQVKQLQAQPHTLQKQASLRDAPTETVRLEQPKWTDELQLFYQADINKPALRGAYQVQTTDSAGLTRRTYRRQPEVDHPVTELTVVQAGTTVRELRATVDQHNPLFFSGKRLHLQFGPDGTLRRYDVVGRQKLIGFDTTRYEAHGQVTR